MKPDDPRHGTENGYKNLACRCERCREAHRLWFVAYRRRNGVRPEAEYREAVKRHGVNRYKRGRCRCDICRAAIAEEKRLYRRRHPEHERFLQREQKRRRRLREKGLV